MAVLDRTRSLASIIPLATDGIRYATAAENNVRTERYQLRVQGQVDITVAGAALANRGSILAALSEIGFTDGGADRVVMDARLARFLAECLAPSPLPATRLAGVGIQAATQLEEIVPIFLSAYRTVNPGETKYVEPNKQLAQSVFVTPNRSIGRLATGAPTGTITGLTVAVEQVYDELMGQKPWLSAFTRQIVQDVSGANPALRVDLRGTKFVRGIVIQQDTDQGEVSNIINGLVLRSDKFSLIGDRAVPFADLAAAQAYEFGGDLPPGYLFIDFVRLGRLSSMWNPYQDTNLRLELDVQPAGGGATGSKVRVAMLEYDRSGVNLDPLPVNI